MAVVIKWMERVLGVWVEVGSTTPTDLPLLTEAGTALLTESGDAINV